MCWNGALGEDNEEDSARLARWAKAVRLVRAGVKERAVRIIRVAEVIVTAAMIRVLDGEDAFMGGSVRIAPH